MENLSTMLRDLRIKKSLTQEELGALAGLSRRSISALENDEFGSVNLSSLTRVLGALGYQLDIKPASAPTLDDLLMNANSSFETEASPRRVRHKEKEDEVPPCFPSM